MADWIASSFHCLEIGRSGKAWFPLARALGSTLSRTACPSDSAPRNDVSHLSLRARGTRARQSIKTCGVGDWIASGVLRTWIIGSSKFYHSFFFAFAKTHSYRTSTQDVLGAFQAHGALAKIRSLAMTSLRARGTRARQSIKTCGVGRLDCFVPFRHCLGFPSRSLLSLISLSLSSAARLASPVLASSFAPRVSPVRGHYLQTNVYSFVCYLVVTPFFRLCYSSAEKEGKSAAMTGDESAK